MHRNEIDESPEAKKKVNDAWRKAIYYAHPDRGGKAVDAVQANNAKRVLSNAVARDNYIDALEEYDIDDGLQIDP